jgi:hypothetical protein
VIKSTGSREMGRAHSTSGRYKRHLTRRVLSGSVKGSEKVGDFRQYGQEV